MIDRRGAWAHAAPALCLIAAACASIEPPPTSSLPVDSAALTAPFNAEGRLSARRGNDGFSGHFEWTHDGARDAIVLSTPLGQTVARLDGDATGARAELSDGRIEQAADWEALTTEALGMALPVRGLSGWLRGLPRSDSPHTVERDARARPVLLRQDGWEIVFGYEGADAPRASRLTLRYASAEPIEVRIVGDRWQ